MLRGKRSRLGDIQKNWGLGVVGGGGGGHLAWGFGGSLSPPSLGSHFPSRLCLPDEFGDLGSNLGFEVNLNNLGCYSGKR